MAALVPSLLLLAGIAYAPLLGYELSTGDTWPLLFGTRLESWRDIPGFFTSRLLSGTSFPGDFYRPVALLSFAVDQWLWGADPRGFYLTNIFIHGASAALVYVAGRGLTFSVTVSVSAAALFVVHPLAIEVVPSIARRQDMLACLFSLSSIVAFIRWRTSERDGWLVVACIACLAALSSKEIAIFTPVVSGLCLLLLGHPGARRSTCSVWVRFFVAHAAALSIYLGARALVVGSVDGYGDRFDLERSIGIAVSALQQMFLGQGGRALASVPGVGFDDRLIARSLALVLIIFVLASAWSGRARSDGRARAIVSIWLMLPLAVCIATNTYASRSLYSSLPPVCLLLAHTIGGLRPARSHERTGAGGHLLGLGAAAIVLVLTFYSPLFHRYDHWRHGSDAFAAMRLAIEAEIGCEDLAGVDVVNLYGASSFRRYYKSRLPAARSVSYFRRYVIASLFEQRGCPVRIGTIEFVERDPRRSELPTVTSRRSGARLDLLLSMPP